MTDCEQVECPEGEVLKEGVCVPCPAGQYEFQNKCLPCAAGTYTDQPGTVSRDWSLELFLDIRVEDDK